MEDQDMAKTLYLMRHGQTLFNLQKKIQGWCDSPLTELGIKQAEIAGKYFADNNIQFDHVYSSSSERACDTADAVLRVCGQTQLPVTRTKGLKEWNFGAYEGKDECLNPPLPYGDFFKTWGGDGEMDVRNRMNETLREIMNRDGHDVVLAVSHGGSSVQFSRMWDAVGKVHFTRGFRNCSIFKFEVTEDAFILVDIIQHDFSSLA